MQPLKFVATINTPGHLPEHEPELFGTAKQAWSWLADQRADHEEGLVSEDEFIASDTYCDLTELADEVELICFHWGHEPEVWLSWLASLGVKEDGTGSVTGPTPGYTGDHDLGLVYTVAVAT